MTSKTGDHLTPAQAAEEWGVSGPTLRRHALIYEKLFGPLSRAQGQRR